MGRRFFGRRRPQADEQFGEIAHARAGKPFATGMTAEGLGHARALDVVAPKFPFDRKGGGMGIARATRLALHHGFPVAPFVGLRVEVVVNHLFVTIKAHGRRRGGGRWENSEGANGGNAGKALSAASGKTRELRHPA